MRTRALAAALTATVVVSTTAAAADSATTTRTYLRVAAAATFSHELDYGSDPRGTFNGKFQRVVFWTMNGIAVYRSRSSQPRGRRCATRSATPSPTTSAAGP